jgi:ubiquitin-protein ligase
VIWLGESLSFASCDQSLNKQSAKKVAKVKKLLLVNNEDNSIPERNLVKFEKLCLKYTIKTAVNVILFVLVDEIQTLIRASTNNPSEKFSKAKGLNSDKGIGYGWKKSDNNVNLSDALKIARERNSALLEHLLPFFNLIKIFLTSRIEDIRNCEDPSVFSCIYQSGLNQALGFVMNESSIDDISRLALIWICAVDICQLLSENINLIPLFKPSINLSSDFEKFIPLYKVLSHVSCQLAVFDIQSENELFCDFSAKVSKICEIISGFILDITKRADQNLSSRNQQSSEQNSIAKANLNEWLQSQQFGFARIANDFKYSAEAEKSANAVASPGRLRRIRRELAILSSDLPKGIFVKVNEDRPDLIKVLIIGPEGTPYENGCFLFDMFLPPEYPNVPPKVSLLTVGDGFRFNPNLYSSGYVCLSLLGTWTGPSWDVENSTLLQVFVSIQAMIMNAEPYCNEPAWYNMQGSSEALQYSKKISEATALYAILWQLESSAKENCIFTEIIASWMFLRKDEILAQLSKWNLLYCDVPDQYAYPISEMQLSIPWDETKTRLFRILQDFGNPRKSLLIVD